MKRVTTVKQLVTLLVVLFTLEKAGFGCIGTGYTCDRGAIEIHVPLSFEKIDAAYKKANVKPYGQLWGVRGNISAYYTDKKPILLYVFDNGVRLQIAVKNFTVHKFLNESCEFWDDPKNLDAKNITEQELRKLKSIGAINLTENQIRKIVEFAEWGVAGNMWIDVREGLTGVYAVNVGGVRGCGGGFVAILSDTSYWDKNLQEVEEKLAEKESGRSAIAVISAVAAIFMIIVGFYLIKHKK